MGSREENPICITLSKNSIPMTHDFVVKMVELGGRSDIWRIGLPRTIEPGDPASTIRFLACVFIGLVTTFKLLVFLNKAQRPQFILCHHCTGVVIHTRAGA
ncbi:hypothetical protein I7I50_02882 [Histoplasma capsulatum G186AR]|uniref:Uncharacterized protein n=1 Tax=Ajellomyces capsulatus TaxID=5037 RepID=A0A8H7Z229_AJECA|nr:hypothetical protein I7I52_00452 [Histoplasma capsulatum]QSS71875.1 hypothetical protein I7I50_02882 [Histoplasma capsulatum G186AR]